MPATRKRPTLDQVRRWAATINVEDAALALGTGRSTLYEAIAAGASPVQTILVGQRIRVLTFSLIEVLEGRGTKASS